jgi:hypothetical protein
VYQIIARSCGTAHQASGRDRGREAHQREGKGTSSSAWRRAAGQMTARDGRGRATGTSAGDGARSGGGDGQSPEGAAGAAG